MIRVFHVPGRTDSNFLFFFFFGPHLGRPHPLKHLHQWALVLIKIRQQSILKHLPRRMLNIMVLYVGGPGLALIVKAKMEKQMVRIRCLAAESG